MRIEGRNTVSSLLAVLLAALVAAWILGAQKAPAAVPATAPDNDFSAERAMAHVDRLGAAARPLGTPAHAKARDYLLEQLESLGLETQLQVEDVVQRRGVDRFLAVRARNVVGRLPGRTGGQAVLVASHYDSRPNTPGAGDALSGVAAILEALRALRTGEQLDNDVIVLITDAEEIGLVGAQAFLQRHPWADSVRMVVNLEARGNRGPVAMFETRPGNAPAIAAVKAAVPQPYATSMSYEVYRRMPNDTDFSVFRRAGVQGLNFAPVGQLAAYHTRLDSPQNLSRASLQHHGSSLLGLVRHLGVADLDEVSDASQGNAVYFNPYPWRLIVYPGAWALPLAVAAGLVWLVAFAVGRRSGVTLAGTFRGLFILLANLAASGVVGFCFWWAIRNYLPGLLYGPYSRPYEVEILAIALTLLTLAPTGALFTWMRDTREELELWAGGWIAWILLSVGLAVAVTGASYLTTWPLVFGALGMLAAGALGESRWRPLLLGVAALPAVVLLAPTISAVAEALTLAASAIIAVLMALLASTVAPQLGSLHLATRGKSSTFFAVAGLAILGWVGVTATPTSDRPAVDTLTFAVDSETGEAWWASFDDQADEWTSSYLGDAPEADWAPAALALPETRVLLASADPISLAPPSIETVSDSRAQGRRVEGRITSARESAVLRIRAEASVPLLAVSIAGERFQYQGDPEAEGLGEVTVSAYGFGTAGLSIGFELEEAWPIELSAVDQIWGFEALPEPPASRPGHLMPSPSWRTDSVYVRASGLM